MELNGTLLVQLIHVVLAWYIFYHLLFKHLLSLVQAERERMRRLHAEATTQEEHARQIIAAAEEAQELSRARFATYEPPRCEVDDTIPVVSDDAYQGQADDYQEDVTRVLRAGLGINATTVRRSRKGVRS